MFQLSKYDRLMYPAQCEALEVSEASEPVSRLSVQECLQSIKNYIARNAQHSICASLPLGGDLQVTKRGVTFAICADPAKSLQGDAA